MSLQSSTLRPGVLVSLKTSVAGNVSYNKTTIEAAHLVEDGTQQAKWQTERTIVDVNEHNRAKTTRGRCRSLITGVCAQSAFGLLCPENKAKELEDAIAEARRLADQFNADAKVTKIEVYVMCGRIEPNDYEAVRAINSELRDLLEEMKTGLAAFNVDAIRAAANKARAIGSMLSTDAASRLKGAIDSARGAARKIVSAGEVASREMTNFAIGQITEARTAFLDLDTKPADVQAPEEAGRALDLVPTDDAAPATAPSVEVPAFELAPEDA